MSQRKNSEDVTNDEKIKTQLSTNEEKKDSFKEDEIKIVIDNDNEKMSKEDSDKGVVAFGGMKPDGQLVGSQSQPSEQSQHAYLGGNPYQNPTPNLTPYRISTQDPSNSPPLLEFEPTSMMYNPEMRNSFIKYILTIVFIMLVMTAAFIAVVLAVPAVKDAFSKNRLVILIPTIFLIFVVNYAMTCLVPITRHPPGNVIFLLLSVVGMSVLCGVVTSYYSTNIVLYAFVATTAVVFVCILLACTHFDFTSYFLYVIVLVTAFSVLVVVILTTLMVAKTPLKPAFLAFLVIATLLQVLILTIHLQTIIGGRTIELNEQDYALGAYMLYMSIIDIFMKMVFMFGISSEM